MLYNFSGCGVEKDRVLWVRADRGAPSSTWPALALRTPRSGKGHGAARRQTQLCFAQTSTKSLHLSPLAGVILFPQPASQARHEEQVR